MLLGSTFTCWADAGVGDDQEADEGDPEEGPGAEASEGPPKRIGDHH